MLLAWSIVRRGDDDLEVNTPGGAGTQHVVGSSYAGDRQCKVAKSHCGVSWDVEVWAGVE